MKVVVIGAGGHARSVLEALRAGETHEVVCCTDPRTDLVGTDLDGVPIVGDDALLPDLLAEGVAGACIGLGGSRDNQPRARLFRHAASLGFALPQVVHPAATISSRTSIGSGCVVLAGAVVGAGARLDENVVINTAAVVEHDCVLEADVHLATGAVLGGGVVVERLAHVGLGATVINGVRIGAGAIVGAGSVVIRNVAPGTTVAGCPAVPLRPDR